MIGEDNFFIIVFTITFWCLNKNFGYRLGFTYLSSAIVNVALKETFRIPRPIGRPGIRSLRLETAGDYSFPSGHAQATATLWTSIMIKVRKRWLYLGVHTLADVTGGMIVGVCWVLICRYLVIGL
ncbi:MAG TPA: hypothetical protein GXX51_05910 [Firmicutes bacterium]|nr:hypothetical protein [Bacillota bacterium]